MRPSRNTTICQFSAKRQRAEVEVEDQSPEELKQFQGAKDKEPDQWLAETIKRFGEVKFRRKISFVPDGCSYGKM